MKNKIRILSVAALIAFLAFFYFAVYNAKNGNEQANYDVLVDAIHRSAVQCYAVEGFYPPDIRYLEDNYGLMVDHDKYVVMYSVFASNIMPEIEVFNK